jgi:Ca2+-binding EF-hand superfamily protein
MIVYEAQIEEYRKKLAEAGDFNLIDAFSMLDQKNLGWLSTLQLFDFLGESGIYIHKDDLYNFFRRYDHDHDARLSY